MDKKKKRIIIGAGIVILAGALGTGIYFSQKKSGTQNKELAYVTNVGVMNETSLAQRMAGVVEPQKTLDIQKNAEREIKDILVKVGDEVDVGTSLFSYDTSTLETELQQAQLELERADNDMANLRTQIAQLEKEKKSAPGDEKFSYTTQIQTAQMDLKKSEYERKSKEVEMNQMREKILNSTVTSEMKGVIKSINEGNEMDPYSGNSQAFMTILATGDYRVKGKVNEQNIGEIVEEEKAIVRSRVDEDKFWTGTFTAVDTENREGNNNNGFYGGMSEGSEEVTSSAYPFYINLDSSEGLMLGQHVYIERDSGIIKKDGIWLDEGFIAGIDKEPYVWIENDEGKLEKRKVTLGGHDDVMFQYEITDGITAEDYIAFPQEFLKEGIKTTHEEIPMENAGMEGEMMEGAEGEAGMEGMEGAEGEAGMEGVEGEAGMEGVEGEAGMEGTGDGAGIEGTEAGDMTEGESLPEGTDGSVQ